MPAAAGVCAEVKLRLEQQAVMTRTAFDATLELVNGEEVPLENVRVELTIYGPDGSVATTADNGTLSLFNIDDLIDFHFRLLDDRYIEEFLASQH